MKELLSILKTPKECEELAKIFTELAQQARRRAIDLRATSHDYKSEVEKELARVIYAYEEVLTKKNNRKTRANRTWQMVNRHGIIKAAERAVNRPADAMGYKLLVEMGMKDLTFEAIILRYPETFSKSIVELCRNRLEKLEMGERAKSNNYPKSRSEGDLLFT